MPNIRVHDHNQICTEGNVIEVGKKYTYKVSMPSVVEDIEILEDNTDDEGVKLNVRFVDSGETVYLFAAAGHYAYSGMWRIYDLGTYHKLEGFKKEVGKDYGG